MAAHPIRAENGTLLLAVWVVPGANRTEIVGVHGDLLKIRVAAPAAAGAANQALLRLLKKILGCDVSIASGQSSRRKVIHVDSGDLARTKRALGIESG